MPTRRKKKATGVTRGHSLVQACLKRTVFLDRKVRTSSDGQGEPINEPEQGDDTDRPIPWTSLLIDVRRDLRKRASNADATDESYYGAGGTRAAPGSLRRVSRRFRTTTGEKYTRNRTDPPGTERASRPRSGQR